jgi:uncharacterized protein (DUF697 family)/predicted GTPase
MPMAALTPRPPSAEEAFRLAKERLIRKAPPPLLWMFGKTQSGKSSIIRFLTGIADISIGLGFRPTTKQSTVYDFPTSDAPLLRFVDTRGLGEVKYDPTEDLAKFNDETQLVLVTVRLTDMALEPVLEPLRRIRAAQPRRPVLLAVTTLHLAYPQKQHPPYPFADTLEPEGLDADVRRLLDEQRKKFHGLVDAVVPIDLTRAEEGFEDATYGGQHLRDTLLKFLPDAYRQSLLKLDEDMNELREMLLNRAFPSILRTATLAGTAGAVPVPLVDIPIVAALQSRLVYKLAKLYGQPHQAQRFLEAAGIIGVGALGRVAIRQVTKLIPWVGSVAGGAYSFGVTYAIGRSACWYYGEILSGHMPQADEVKSVLGSAFESARHLWQPVTPPPAPPVPPPSSSEGPK